MNDKQSAVQEVGTQKSDEMKSCMEYFREMNMLQQFNMQKMFNELKSVLGSQREQVDQPNKTEPNRRQQNFNGQCPYNPNWRQRNQYLNSRRCFHCGEGHIIARCPQLQADGDPGSFQQDRREVAPSVTNHIKGEKGAYLQIDY